MGFKRGQGVIASLLYLAVELTIVVIVLVAMMGKITALAKEQPYYQRFLARDFALTADALHSAEGNFTLYYFYSTPTEAPLDFLLIPGEFRIYRADERNLSNESKHYSAFLFGRSDYVEVKATLLNASGENSVILEDVFGRRLAFQKREGSLAIDNAHPSDIELPVT